MGFSLSIAWEKLPHEVQNLLLYGDQDHTFEIKLEYGRGKKGERCKPSQES